MAEDGTQIILNTLSAATPWDVYTTALSLTKLGMTVSLLALVVALVLAIVRRGTGGRRSGVLDVTGVVGLVAGVAGAAYTALVSWTTAQHFHVTSVYVVLPAIITAVYAVGLGILVWLVARIGNAGAKRG